jgi:hypothetical protein
MTDFNSSTFVKLCLKSMSLLAISFGFSNENIVLYVGMMKLIKCLRLLKHWGRRFESPSRHGCLHSFCVCVVLCR